MTPVRAAIAAVLAAIMLFAGSFVVARVSGREFTDFVEVLLAGWAPGLLCFLAAVGAVFLGGIAILTAFLAFIAREEEDSGPFRRRGFPKSAPILFIALSLALVWVALRCTSAPVSQTPIAMPVEPAAAPAEDIDVALDGGEPLPAVVPQGESYLFGEADFYWGYKDPLVRGRAASWLSAERPFSDDAEEAYLCGKAWVAVTGSASEEGPADRNAERARVRAIAAREAARRWLARHPDCGETFVFAIDLGQHAGGAADDTGAATAFQRQVLVISRARYDGEALTAEAARNELAALIDNPARRADWLGGRRFPAEPVILP